MSSPSPSATAHLDGLRTRLDSIDAAVRGLLVPLADDARLRRPAPDRWGVADCFEHLIATGQAYHPIVRAVLDADRIGLSESHRRASYRPTWFGGWFVRTASEGGPRLRTFRTFAPPPAHADAPERFLSQQTELRALLDDARGRDLRALRVRSPALPLLTLRLGECLAMLVGHQERHLKQARTAGAV